MKNKKEYSSLEEIKKDYANRRARLVVAEVADGIAGLVGFSGGLGAFWETQDLKYLGISVGAGLVSYLGYRVLENVITKKNPQREEKELMTYRRNNKDKNITLENF